MQKKKVKTSSSASARPHAAGAVKAGKTMENSFQKGLRLMEFIALCDHPVGVREVARELDLAKTTAHRLLQVLVDGGYVSRDGNSSRYSLNLKLWALSNAGLQRFNVRDFARRHMIDLCRATGETVYLSMLQDVQVVVIDKVDADQPLQVFSTIGGRYPAHCLATGKVILAYLGEAYWDEKLNSLPAVTGRTLHTKADLKREFNLVRKQGYAISDGEWVVNVVGVAAPILDATNKPIAAISIAGPTERFGPSTVRKLIPLIVSAAREISQHLGWRDRGVAS